MSDDVDVIADVIVLTVDAALAPLLAKNADLEARLTATKDLWQATEAALADLRQRFAALETRAVTPGPKGDPGEKGESGPSGERGAPGVDGAHGLNGKDFDPEFVKASIAEVVAALPVPRDGKNGIDGKDAVLPDVEAIAARAAQLLPVPKDGRDGQPGVPGRDGELGQKGLDGAAGRDGINGKDGRDGTLEDVVVKQIDDRHAQFCRADGSVLGTFKTASLRDRGVFKEGEAYEAGDGATFAGSFFIAQEDTTSKPETDHTWRLAVKRGRDGRNGLLGPTGPQGPRGESGVPGRDYR